MVLGWYLDCSPRFVSIAKELFHNILVVRALIKAKALEEEPKEAEAQSKKPKDKVDKAGKAKSKKFGTQASQARVTTHSTTKALAKPSSSPVTIGVGSPFVSPSTASSVTLFVSRDAPSKREAIVSTMQYKRKAMALDSSATSFELCSTYTLIENLGALRQQPHP